MQEVKTLSFKVENIQKDEYLDLFYECALLFDYYAAWSFKHKTWNKNTCHKSTYNLVNSSFPKVKTALQQTVRDCAMEVCKRSKFKTAVPQKKNISGIRLDKRCFSLRGQFLSLIGITKRHKAILHVADAQKDIFNNWKVCAATLNYIKKKKQFWINITFKNPKEIELHQISSSSKILGIDRGLYHVAVTNNNKFYSSNKIRAQRRKFLYIKTKLQQKGTRSAKRLLKKRSGREKRYMKDVNHCITKAIAKSDSDVFVLENLKGIRQQRRGKVMNKWLSDWSFYQFEQILIYKANALGKQVVYISPKYTSKKCSQCGNMHSQSRNHSHYHCRTCGHKQHADLNAAINIKQNYILSTTNKSVEQAAVNQPHVSLVHQGADTSL